MANWKLLNPFDFLTDFDRWFAFEVERAYRPARLRLRLPRRVMIPFWWEITAS